MLKNSSDASFRANGGSPSVRIDNGNKNRLTTDIGESVLGMGVGSEPNGMMGVHPFISDPIIIKEKSMGNLGHSIPDLNEVEETERDSSIPILNYPLQETASKNLPLSKKASNKKKGAKSKYLTSLKLKDMIRASQGNGSRFSSEERRGASKGVVDSVCGSSSANDTSCEIRKTMEIGKEVGYQLDDAMQPLREIIAGEGVKTNAQ
ncbi:hypothetical protein L2E82_50381 [Cichorium intybus]|nr:hypothetical protein L2E82_50381 [Cichorium intybus]